MSHPDLAVASSGRTTGQRRLWRGAAFVGLLGLALATWWLLGPHGVSAEDRVRSDGYVAIGTQNGDTFWAKVTAPGELSVVSTGQDGALCNGTAPDVVGMDVCNGGVSGQAYIIVTVAPTGTARVRLDTSQGSRTLSVIGDFSGTRHAIAVGVFRGETFLPVVLERTYLSANGSTLMA